MSRMIKYYEIFKGVVKELAKTTKESELISETNKCKALTQIYGANLVLETGVKKTFATAQFGRKRITVYFESMEKVQLYDEEIHKIMIHEIMHLIAGAWYTRDVGHNATFKAMFPLFGYDRELGGAGFTPKSGLKMFEKKYKYHIRCSNCKDIVGKRQRRSDLSNYISKCCKADFYFEEIVNENN